MIRTGVTLRNRNDTVGAGNQAAAWLDGFAASMACMQHLTLRNLPYWRRAGGILPGATLCTAE